MSGGAAWPSMQALATAATVAVKVDLAASGGDERPAPTTLPPAPSNVVTDKRPIVKHPASDKYWRKYAQKRLKPHEDHRTNVVRYYYRCTVPDCPAKKTVEKEPWDPLDMAQLRFSEEHNHPITHESQELPSSKKVASAAAASAMNTTQTASAVESAPPTRPSALFPEQHFVNEVQTVISCMHRAICTTLGWPLCQLWVADFQNSHLCRFKCAVNADSPKIDMFQQQSLGLTLSLEPSKDSVSLPCRAWHSAQPTWIQDLTSPKNKCLLHQLAHEAGMLTAGAFPITLNKRLIAVMTVFAPTEVQFQEGDIMFLIQALTSMALACVALYARLSKQPIARVQELLPSLLHAVHTML